MQHTATNVARPEARSLKLKMPTRKTIAAVLALLIAGTSPARAAEPGQTPDTVKAGVDRVVVLGGKTYLAGELTVSPEIGRASCRERV